MVVELIAIKIYEIAESGNAVHRDFSFLATESHIRLLGNEYIKFTNSQRGKLLNL